MMLVSKRNHVIGFTLIELLVVIVIMALATGAVGPSLIKQYDSMKRQQEIKKLEFQLRFIGQQAYYHREGISVVLDGKTMNKQVGGDERSFEFEHLFFQPTKILFNKHGNPSVSHLNATVDGHEFLVDIPKIY